MTTEPRGDNALLSDSTAGRPGSEKVTGGDAECSSRNDRVAMKPTCGTGEDSVRNTR